MIGAGTILNPIIKVVTTVAILAAVYFFLVKPVLDTTNEAFEQFGIEELVEDLPADIQNQVNSALEQTSGSNATRLGECIRRAQTDQIKIRRCLDRF